MAFHRVKRTLPNQMNVNDPSSLSQFLDADLSPGDILVYDDGPGSLAVLDDHDGERFTLCNITNVREGTSLVVISALRMEKLFMSWRSLRDRRELAITHAAYVLLDEPMRLAWIAV